MYMVFGRRTGGDVEHSQRTIHTNVVDSWNSETTHRPTDRATPFIFMLLRLLSAHQYTHTRAHTHIAIIHACFPLECSNGSETWRKEELFALRSQLCVAFHRNRAGSSKLNAWRNWIHRIGIVWKKEMSLVAGKKTINCSSKNSKIVLCDVRKPA